MVARRYLAALLLVPLVAACATSATERRAQARQEYTMPAETTDLALQKDLDQCATQGDDAGRGFTIAGSVMMGVGVLLWPLLPVGMGFMAVAAGASESAKNECMTTAGYLKK